MFRIAATGLRTLWPVAAFLDFLPQRFRAFLAVFLALLTGRRRSTILRANF